MEEEETEMMVIDVHDDEVEISGDEHQFSSALVVEPKDLLNLSIDFEEEGNKEFHTLKSMEVEEIPNSQTYTIPQQLDTAKPGTSASSAMTVPTVADKIRLTSQNPVNDIRQATSQYLQGEISLAEFADAMEYFEQYKLQEEGDTAPRRQEPSFVLLNSDASSKTETKPSQVIVTAADTDNSEETLAKLKGEFFRTGDDPTTFSIRRKKKMSPTIKNMMGEAHLRYARGDLVGAESLCLEVIKEQPTYKDPFHTLAMIYESQNRVKKSLQFYLISGLLDPKNFDDWPRLAELSIEEGNIPQAMMCLNKAVVSDPTNTKVHIRKSDLLSDAGDYKGALKGYNKALQTIEDDGAAYMDIAKRVAGIHFKNDDLDQAYEALSVAVSKFSDQVSTAELNLIVEICISLKRYVKAISLFIKFSGVQFHPPLPRQSFKERYSLMSALSVANTKCVVPTGLHADLVQKLIIVLIHLEAFEMVKPILTKLKNTETIDEFGLQFYEIAEAYIAKQQYECSLKILTSLINTEKYSMAEIWLRYSECLFLLNRLEDSAEAYSKVITMAPGHKIARLNLSVILQRLGKLEVALEILGPSEVEDVIDQDLLVEKCNILYSRDRISEFYETALRLFSRHCPEIRNLDEARVLVITSHTNQMLEALKAFRTRKGEPVTDQAHKFEEKESENLIGEWTVYVKLLRLLLQMNRIDLFSRVVYTVWSSPLFCTDENMKKDMDLHCTFATILSSDAELTSCHIKALFGRYGISSIMLNLLSLATRRCGHTKYGKQIVRFLMKHPSDTRLMMLSANNSFMNGTYKYALMEYLALVQLRPSDPLVYLMVASTLLHMASQKYAGNRSQLMVQAIAFINRYADIRGECQETFYNLGRFYHYMGLIRQGMAYYKKVLAMDPVDDKTNPNENISDLKREAAFNIAQMYKAANCWELARQYIHRYVTI